MALAISLCRVEVILHHGMGQHEAILGDHLEPPRNIKIEANTLYSDFTDEQSAVVRSQDGRRGFAEHYREKLRIKLKR